MDSGIILPARPLGVVRIRATNDRPPAELPAELILPNETEIALFGRSNSDSHSYHNYSEDLVEEVTFSELTLEAFITRSIIAAKQIIDSYTTVVIDGGLNPDTSEQERIGLEKILDTIADTVKEKELSEDNEARTGFYL